MNKETPSLDSFHTRTSISSGGKTYEVSSLPLLEKAGFPEISRLPVSLRILLENLLRLEDGRVVKKADIEALARWDAKAEPSREIQFTPARVLLQDFTGVPCVVDLAAMRDQIQQWGGDPARINPLRPADLVIDHSVQVDSYGTPQSFAANAKIEFERNRERYAFLKWGQTAFDRFRVVPPDTGIVHQVNLEYLASVTFAESANGGHRAFFDTLVGTDSHTTMINGLGVLGWGVGGIEAEAALLGQPISMLIPQVVGFRLSGKLPAGATATDLVLTVTQMLRARGVVGKFVEFFGPGVPALALADRATIANMSPEYGATVGFFPVDEETLRYLRLSGRSDEQVALTEAYFRAQGVFGAAHEPVYSDRLELDLGNVEPSIAGPKRPQDRIALRDSQRSFRKALVQLLEKSTNRVSPNAIERFVGEGGNPKKVPTSMQRPEELGHLGTTAEVQLEQERVTIGHGSIVIAAITSCTNTSNPSVMIAAGLLAKKAADRGMKVPSWVKTSLAPGSKVVTEYLQAAGLQDSLDRLGFNLVGYGCTTCIGNSGPLPEAIGQAVKESDLVVAAVLSGNRNFEGRINPLVRANYLMSPPLVVAYALAGDMCVDVATEPLGCGADGRDVYLRDIWPSPQEVEEAVARAVTSEQFHKAYSQVFEGEETWNSIPVPQGKVYAWPDSTYIKSPSFLHDLPKTPAPLSDIRGARVLALLGDSVTTDHISPAGSIAADGPGRQVPPGAGRRGEAVQLVRLATRKPRGDGPGHVRERPSAQPARARHRGRDHDSFSRPGAAVHFRCRDEIRGGRRPARGPRGERVWLRLVTRLGGEGHASPRRPGGHRRVVRADPPKQPHRHGSAAARVSARRERRVARAHGRGSVRDRRRGGRFSPGKEDARAGDGARRRRAGVLSGRAGRYAERRGLLPTRRNPPLRPAVDDGALGLRGDLSNDPRQQDRPDDRHDDRVDHPPFGAEAEEPHEEPAGERPDQTDDDVHQRALAGASHDLPREPSRDQPDDEPPNDSHAHLLACEILDIRSASAPAPMAFTSVGCCA